MQCGSLSAEFGPWSHVKTGICTISPLIFANVLTYTIAARVFGVNLLHLWFMYYDLYCRYPNDTSATAQASGDLGRPRTKDSKRNNLVISHKAGISKNHRSFGVGPPAFSKSRPNTEANVPVWQPIFEVHSSYMWLTTILTKPFRPSLASTWITIRLKRRKSGLSYHHMLTTSPWMSLRRWIRSLRMIINIVKRVNMRLIPNGQLEGLFSISFAGVYSFGFPNHLLPDSPLEVWWHADNLPI